MNSLSMLNGTECKLFKPHLTGDLYAAPVEEQLPT